MSNRVLTSALLLVFAAAGALAQAQEEPPSRVGRIALAQGQVSISGEVGEPAQAATVNWPVSERDLITTARGARTELRIGSTAIRLDGDTSLEVTALDDDSMRLRLHYGTASIRISNPEVLGGFELSTPQGRVRMQEPGRIRVDAERTPDTSSVTVFDGVALVEGGGASINLRAGKRAELRDDDVRTAQAGRDGFDDWSAARDRLDERVVSTRYVATEMTGYEELDRHGSWRVDDEYGPVWIPTVSTTWVPYRDGRWVWVNPWGWTWVDNAPWGYAPFHYGRWVHLNNRWGWVPGRRDVRPAWAPALVGWVGGGGWSVSFNLSNRHHAMPATGWYPLSPRDHFVPHFRASDDYVRRLNHHGRRDWRHDRRDNDYRHRGLTVVPQDHFGKRGQVEVPKVPLAVVPPRALPPQPAATPPAPPPSVRDWRHRDRVEDRFERRGDHPREQREPRAPMPAPVLSNQPQPVTVATPPPQMRPPLGWNRPEPRQPVTAATPAPSLQPNQPQPQWRAPEPRQPVTVVTPMPPVQPQQPAMPPRGREDRQEQFEERRGRWGRHLSTEMAEDRARPQQAPAGIAQPRFERPAPQPQPAAVAPPPVAAPQPRPMPMPMPQPMPAPAAQQPPAPVPAALAPPPQRPSPSPRGEDRGRRGEDGVRQQER